MSGVPWAALGFGAVGAAAAVRALWRPCRAVITDGFALRCAGASCDPAMLIESYGGVQGIYAVARGRVLSSTANGVHVALTDEPVVLGYDADAGHPLRPDVPAGTDVGAGQIIARSDRVRFSVYVVWRDASGTKLVPNEPAAWLAARGMRISDKKRAAGQSWCEQGRTIVVPEAVGKCGIRLPTPGGFALLPVSVTMG